MIDTTPRTLLHMLMQQQQQASSSGGNSPPHIPSKQQVAGQPITSTSRERANDQGATWGTRSGQARGMAAATAPGPLEPLETVPGQRTGSRQAGRGRGRGRGQAAGPRSDRVPATATADGVVLGDGRAGGGVRLLRKAVLEGRAESVSFSQLLMSDG